MRKMHRAQTATRQQDLGPIGFGENSYFFRELGSTGNYFRGSGEQVHSFGDLVSTPKSKKKYI